MMEFEVKHEPSVEISCEYMGSGEEPNASFSITSQNVPSASNEPSCSKKRKLSDDASELDFWLEDEMQTLLQEWGLSILTERFARNMIDVSVLDYIVDIDIVDLCKGLPMRYRLVLRHKLNQKSYKVGRELDPVHTNATNRKRKEPSALIPQNAAPPAAPYQDLPPQTNSSSVQSNTPPTVVYTTALTRQKWDYNATSSLHDFPSDLRNFLCTTPIGKCIVMYYDAKNELDNAKRNELVKIIVLEAIKRGIPLMHAFFKIMSERIKAAFPNELQETFYSPPNKTGEKLVRAAGKFITRKPKILQCLAIPGGAKDVDKPGERDNEEGVKEDNEQEAARVWLIEGREPKEAVRDNWMKCSKLRKKKCSALKSAEEIVAILPIIQTSWGIHLVALDFEDSWPGALDHYYRSFPRLRMLMERLFDSIRDEEAKERVRMYRATEHEETKNLLLAMLWAPLVPTNYRVSGTWRPSLKETLEGFILHIRDAGMLDQLIEDRKKFLNEKSSPNKVLRLQPFIVVVGDLRNPSYFVTYDCLRYPVPSIVEAIALAMQVIFSLHLSYNDESKPLWLFIQQYLFQIQTVENAKSTDEIIRKLRAMCE